MKASRSRNAAKNVVVGVIAQLITLALSVVSRRIFVNFLSTEYLGVNGLYSNILSVLALAELGVGSVTQFFLYKPVAENDYDQITYLVRYFRKLYVVIAAAVLTLGLLLIPFLNLIVNSDLSQNELILYYLLFLINSVVSYFSADKIALLAANQDNRLQKYIAIGSSIVFQLMYILVLMLWHNYTIYVTVTILCTLSNVIVVNWISYKRYPYLRNKEVHCSKPVDKKKITNDLKATFLYKIGATIVNNTSNIMISIMVSTAMVGLYSNYYMIVVAIQGFIAIVSKALVSGIGNLSVSKDTKRMREVFNAILLTYNIIAVFGGVSLYLLFNDFIPIWLGEEYLLELPVVFVISFSFYLTNAISPLWIFREANGLFKKVKYLFLYTALFNIVFSIILGKLWGVFGILLAPSLARIVTQVWYEPRVVYRSLFGTSSMQYWGKQLRYFACAAIALLGCYYVHSVMPHSFVFILLKAVFFLLIVCLVFALGSFRTAEFYELIARVKRVMHALRRRSA